MPPTPSIKSGPFAAVDRRAAEFDQFFEVDAASFTRGGKIGRQWRAETPGRDLIHFVGGYRPAECTQQHGGIAGIDHRGVVTAHHRLERVTGWLDFTQVPNERGGHEGLADIGTGRGDEISGHG